MKVYVVSRSVHPQYALDGNNIIEACSTGPDPQGDAQSYAKDYVKDTDNPAWIHEVDITRVGGYKVEKAVVAVAAE